MSGNGARWLNDADGLQLTALGLNKQVRKDLNLLQDISICIQPNEFVVIVGQSGGGKTTLLDTLSGYRPATSGRVYVNQVDAYENFDAIRTMIGYVPQRDIIHMELTVYQALDYAAQLRLPRHTTREERHERIMQVLEELDLTHRKDVRVSGLSGGQQKRVSIGVELLTRPRLFFLDEPTSGLDPGTETSMMLLLRRLADQGRTVVMVTHATKNVMLADKVIFLARGGYMAWFGPPAEALEYFMPFATRLKKVDGPIEFDDIYAILEDSSLGSAADWASRYHEHAAYQHYIVENIEKFQTAGEHKINMRDRLQQARRNFQEQIRPLRQFMVLSARNLRILAHDRAGLILMLLAPPLVACLDLLIASVMGRDVFDYYQGASVGASQTLLLLTLYALMVSSLSQMREIVKESAVYKRERLVNLRILPYVGSKVWVALLLAFYQAAAFTGIRYLAFDIPGGREAFWMIYVTVFLATLTGMLLGLFASALSPSSATAPMITILLIIPNIVLNGALVTLPASVSQVSSSYWAFKALVGITGIGSDIDADDCWKFPEELRLAMSVEDKEALGCRCMGLNIFMPQSCNFPGTGKFYTPEIDQSSPSKPADLGEPPPEPAFPPAPQEPPDAYDKLAVAEYLNSLQDYQDGVAKIQADYKRQVEAYQLGSAVYQAEMVAYQSSLSEWYVARAAAIGAAEGNVMAVRERFGWAFIDQHDWRAYTQAIVATWQAQGIIAAVMIGLILILVKLKDKQA